MIWFWLIIFKNNYFLEKFSGTDHRMSAKGFQEANYFRDYYNFKFNQKVMTDQDHEIALIETQKLLTLPVEVIQSGLKNFCKVASKPRLDFIELDLMDRDIYTLNVPNSFQLEKTLFPIFETNWQ